ncbi:unnamed protein product [Caenorhabditis auriculariae]|uniref:Uncharacterized protein n=1 Tax=Caenorhabditis auriculariae TaxID=2777116 RepID=A0A8S1HH37_9PELO|nr:unnamed protein product [Caenorhabditis auriculariae]
MMPEKPPQPCGMNTGFTLGFCYSSLLIIFVTLVGGVLIYLGRKYYKRRQLRRQLWQKKRYSSEVFAENYRMNEHNRGDNGRETQFSRNSQPAQVSLSPSSLAFYEDMRAKLKRIYGDPPATSSFSRHHEQEERRHSSRARRTRTESPTNRKPSSPRQSRRVPRSTLKADVEPRHVQKNVVHSDGGRFYPNEANSSIELSDTEVARSSRSQHRTRTRTRRASQE